MQFFSVSVAHLPFLDQHGCSSTVISNRNMQINRSGNLSHPALGVLWNIFNAFNCPWKKVITIFGVLTNLCTVCLYLYMYCGTNTQQLRIIISTLTLVG